MNEGNSNNALYKIIGFLKTVDLKSIAKDIVVSIVTGLGSITFGAIRFWAQCDTGLFTILLLVLGFALLWGSFFYVRFRKREKQERLSVDDLPWGKRGVKRVHQYSERARRLALIGIVAVPLLAAGYFVVSNYLIKDTPPDKFVILIADFEGPKPEDYQIRDVLQNGNNGVGGLNEVANDYSADLLVKYTCAIKGSESALRIGKDHNASLVLWGGYSLNDETVRITVHFDMLRLPPDVPPVKPNRKRPRSLPKADLSQFVIQTDLLKELKYLGLLAIGLASYEKEDYGEAIKRFEAALQQPSNPDDEVSHSVASFFKGLCHQQQATEQNDIKAAIKEYDDVLRDVGTRTPTKGEVEIRWKAHLNRVNANMLLALYSPEQDQREVFADAVRAYESAYNDYLNAGISRWVINNNWGFALYELAVRSNGDEAKNYFRKAVTQGNEAVEACAGEGVEANCAVSYFNLGNACYELAYLTEGTERDAFLGQAKDAYRSALEKGYPVEEGIRQNFANLQVLSGELTPGTEGDQYLRDAAQTYRALLKVYQSGTGEHSIDQFNLSYALLTLGQRKGVSKEEAQSALHEAQAGLRSVRDVSCRENRSGAPAIAPPDPRLCDRVARYLKLVQQLLALHPN